MKDFISVSINIVTYFLIIPIQNMLEEKIH